jgi:DNA-binding NarL/FixJ family response regulator
MRNTKVFDSAVVGTATPRNPSKTRILLTGKHALVRAGIRSLVQNMPEVEVLGEASDGYEALQLIKAHQPRVVLMDIAMSGMNGLEATARVSKEFPEVRVLILTEHSSEEYVLHALRAGAAGYMLTDATSSELEFALRSVAEGKDYLSPAISRYVVADHRRRAGEDASPREQLTLRQREILQLIAEGHSTNDIARMLHLSVKTVETHRAEVMRRLDIHNIAGLVRFAMLAGLVVDN